MMLQKHLGNGFKGYQVPRMLQVPSSAKGKRSVRKKAEDNQMYAFELLASVAGDLLVEKKDVPSTPQFIGGVSNFISGDTCKQGELFEKKKCKDEVFDQGSRSEGLLGSKVGELRENKTSLEEHLHVQNATLSIKSDVPRKRCYSEMLSSGIRNEFGCQHFYDSMPKRCCSTGRQSPCFAESWEGKKVNEIQTLQHPELQTDRNLAVGNALDTCSLGGSMQLGPKAPLVSSDSSVELPYKEDYLPHNSSIPHSQGHMELPVDRDDDEKYNRCPHGRTINSKSFRSQRRANSMIRKLLASKFQRPALVSKNGELHSTYLDRKAVSNSRKICFTCRRTHRLPFKRRKLFECSSTFRYDGAVGCKYTPDLAGKCLKTEQFNSCVNFNEGNKASSTISGQRSSHESEDFHVKLRIKSFKVPELFIEIPESATVGSLKKMVMEAVAAILGAGVSVGILLRGKKVRDDHKTLHQAGISHHDVLDNLGFSLEPNPTVVSPSPSSPGEPQCLFTCDTTEPLSRLPPAVPSPDSGTSIGPQELPLSSVVNSPESDHDSIHSSVDAALGDRMTADSRALVPVPAMSPEPLSMVPGQKLKRPELAQRRIRRPFSVSEVEALVQAVEKLGTGRWRDVKIRAFDHASHRTYVDLKDKWKTLVHTARISPQQRRGEQVPQELLDRVLAAHACWSQQQIKFPSKPSPAKASPFN